MFITIINNVKKQLKDNCQQKECPRWNDYLNFLTIGKDIF